MTDDDIGEILLQWATKRGGVFTDDDLDTFSAILEEHFPNGPDAYRGEEVEDRLKELNLI